MCFDIYYLHQEEKIATEDIVCWKYLRKDRTAPHRTYQYEYMQLNKLKEPLEVISYTIDEGFHSHSTLKKCIEQASNSKEYKVFKFIIPAGSKYYYNPIREEYVSDQIVLTKPWHKQTFWEYLKNLKNS